MAKKRAVIRFAKFRPGEAAVMTGMSVDAQRDHRRRGHLSPIAGAQASFTTLDIAIAIIIRTCSERGIGPSLGARLAKQIGPRLFLRVLSYAIAVKDETGVMQKWMADHGKSQLEYFLSKMEEKFHSSPQRFAILWSTDQVGDPEKYKKDEAAPVSFCDDIADAFDKTLKTNSAFGPAIVFDLDNLSRYLINQKIIALDGTPDLVRIVWEDGE